MLAWWWRWLDPHHYFGRGELEIVVGGDRKSHESTSRSKWKQTQSELTEWLPKPSCARRDNGKSPFWLDLGPTTGKGIRIPIIPIRICFQIWIKLETMAVHFLKELQAISKVAVSEQVLFLKDFLTYQRISMILNGKLVKSSLLDCCWRLMKTLVKLFERW